MNKIVKILLICFGCFIGVIITIFAGLMLFGKGNVLLPVAKKMRSNVVTDDDGTHRSN